MASSLKSLPPFSVNFVHKMSRHLKRFWYDEITHKQALTGVGETPDTLKTGLRVVKGVLNTQYTVVVVSCELHCRTFQP